MAQGFDCQTGLIESGEKSPFISDTREDDQRTTVVLEVIAETVGKTPGEVTGPEGRLELCRGSAREIWWIAQDEVKTFSDHRCEEVAESEFHAILHRVGLGVDPGALHRCRIAVHRHHPLRGGGGGDGKDPGAGAQIEDLRTGGDEPFAEPLEKDRGHPEESRIEDPGPNQEGKGADLLDHLAVVAVTLEEQELQSEPQAPETCSEVVRSVSAHFCQSRTIVAPGWRRRGNETRARDRGGEIERAI